MLKLYDCNYSKESLSESLSGHVVLINDYTQDIQGRCDFNATLFQGEWILRTQNEDGIGLDALILIELDAWLEQERRMR